MCGIIEILELQKTREGRRYELAAVRALPLTSRRSVVASVVARLHVIDVHMTTAVADQAKVTTATDGNALKWRNR